MSVFILLALVCYSDINMSKDILKFMNKFRMIGEIFICDMFLFGFIEVLSLISFCLINFQIVCPLVFWCSHSFLLLRKAVSVGVWEKYDFDKQKTLEILQIRLKLYNSWGNNFLQNNLLRKKWSTKYFLFQGSLWRNHFMTNIFIKKNTLENILRGKRFLRK